MKEGVVRRSLMTFWFMIPVITLRLMAQTTPFPVPFERDGQWGYMSPDGVVLVEPIFSQASLFTYDLWDIPQCWDERYQYAEGRTLLGAENVGRLKNPVGIVWEDCKVGLVSIKGEVILPPTEGLRFETGMEYPGYHIFNGKEIELEGHPYQLYAVVAMDGLRVSDFEFLFLDDGGEEGYYSSAFGSHYFDQSFCLRTLNGYHTISSKGKSIAQTDVPVVPGEGGDYLLVKHVYDRHGYGLDTTRIYSYRGSELQDSFLLDYSAWVEYCGYGIFSLKGGTSLHLLRNGEFLYSSNHCNYFSGFNADGYGMLDLNRTSDDAVLIIDTLGQVVHSFQGQVEIFGLPGDYHIQDYQSGESYCLNQAMERVDCDQLNEEPTSGSKNLFFDIVDSMEYVMFQRAFGWGLTDSITISGLERLKPEVWKVQTKSGWGIFKSGSQQVLPFEFDKIRFYDERNILILDRKGKSGAFNIEDMVWILPVQYDKITLRDPYLVVKSGNYYGVADLTGVLVTPIVLPTDISGIREGWHVYIAHQDSVYLMHTTDIVSRVPRMGQYAAVTMEKKGVEDVPVIVFLDSLTLDAKTVLYGMDGTKRNFHDARYFGTFNNLFKARRDGKVGLIDRETYQLIVPFIFDDFCTGEVEGYDPCICFCDRTSSTGLTCYLDKEGRFVEGKDPIVKPRRLGHSNGLTLYQDAQCQHAFADANGDWVTGFIYAYAEPFDSGYAIVREFGKRAGIVNTDFQYVLSPQYDRIVPWKKKGYYFLMNKLEQLSTSNGRDDEYLWDVDVVDYSMKSRFRFKTEWRNPFSVWSDTLIILTRDDLRQFMFNDRFELVDTVASIVTFEDTRLVYLNNAFELVELGYLSSGQQMEFRDTLLLEDGQMIAVISDYPDLRFQLSDPDGSVLIPYKYAIENYRGRNNQSNFQIEDPANELRGILDAKGHIVIPVEYTSIDYLSEYQLYRCSRPNGILVYCDVEGKCFQ
ncbi:MAG: WG repeat-containing protein [Lewinellaceae bacterium]|nr:WG repeat-containing protein [Lewinellaceae bacterium]